MRWEDVPATWVQGGWNWGRAGQGFYWPLQIVGPSTGPAHAGWDRLKLLGVVAFQYHPDHSDPLWDERMIFFFLLLALLLFFAQADKLTLDFSIWLCWCEWMRHIWFIFDQGIFFKGSRFSKFHDREIHLDQDFKDQIKTKMGPD